MKRIISIISLMLLLNIVIKAQVYNISTNNGQTITTCGGDFYDSGGSGGNYGAGENFSITFKSNTTPNNHVQVSFATFNILNTDTLYAYDGPNTSSPLIGKYNNNNPLVGATNAVSSTVLNATGELTFQFISSSTSAGAIGWFASLVCIPGCQQIIASLDTLLTTPHPDSNYIDACMGGDSITFVGNGIFPQNNYEYNQTNANCVFHWNFGDGTTGIGQTIKHKYTISRGYDILLNITDSIGCVNTNALGARVRMASFPNVVIIPLQDMCSNDSVNLKVGYLNNSNIMIQPVSFTQIAIASYDSTTFIPDGPVCPPGYFSTPVTFTTFPPGLTISSASDILAICVTIEHSYSGDLGFNIICPNGQNVILDPNQHNGSNHLGIANLNDSYTYPCDPAYNPPGTGWSYCWSEYYPNHGLLGTLKIPPEPSPIDSTNQVNHTNYLLPANPLSGLVGCPLNGTWSIVVTDNWEIDNGYVFHWDLQLQANLMPVNWTYNVIVDSVGFTGPFVTALNDSIARIHPTTGGNFIIPITLYDDFGCKWDTSTTLTVVQMPTVYLGNDTSFCEGNSITLNAGNQGSSFQWNYSDINGSTNQTIVTKDSVLAGGVPFIYNYVVHVTNQNANVQCTATDSIKVTLNPIPQISFDASPTSGCEPVNVTFTNGTFPIATYVWDFGDSSPTDTSTNPVHTYNSTGSPFSVTLSAATTQGCKATFTASNYINVYPQPHADFTWTPTIGTLSNPVIYFTNTTTPSNSSFTNTWNFGDGTSLNYTQNPSHIYSSASTFDVILIVTDSIHNGCSDTISHSILIINDSLTFPNIITPNGDGHNDNFVIKGLENGAYPDNRLVVYNRWGKKVYDSNNYVNGSFDGEGLSDGVYYYIFTAKGVLRDLKHQSSLEILR